MKKDIKSEKILSMDFFFSKNVSITREQKYKHGLCRVSWGIISEYNISPPCRKPDI